MQAIKINFAITMYKKNHKILRFNPNNTKIKLLQLSNVRGPENLARAGVGLCVEALNFPDSFVTFLIKEKSKTKNKF